jgi:uncharacterized protein (DUF885 family)
VRAARTPCDPAGARYNPRMRAAALAVVLCAAACGPRPAPRSTAATVPPAAAPAAAAASGPLAADARAGVTDPELGGLLVDHWDWAMRVSPVWATTLGDHRFDAQLAHADAASLARQRAERRAFLARARALDPTRLDAKDRVTLTLFVGQLEAAAGTDVCRDEEWSVSPTSGPLDVLGYVVEIHKVETVADGEHLVARLRQGPRMVDDTIDNLRAGLASGRVAPAETVRRAIAELDTALARPTASWKMMAAATAPHPDWTEAQRAHLAAAVTAAVDHGIRPALVRYRDFLRDKVLPHGRTGADEGLRGLPDGAACYRAKILDELGEARSPADLHALGLREVARSDQALAALGKRALHTRDLAATIHALRTDPKLYFTSKDELMAAATADLARAKAAIPRWFGRLPEADCVVHEIPATEAPYTTIAYYRPPHYDGGKPGEFMVNTYRPATRPRYEMAALAAHESIPGHHLQIAIAHELGAVPLFRKLEGTTAFVEGWGLYAERLADEMGLYTSDLDRLGAASFDAWRASRLVVDTGLHDLGWTRARAEAFMREHTALTDENISNEVDRYLATPAQALAYKVGQLTILELRAKAEQALGDRFDIRGFHDAVLGGGAVTLPVLAAQVQAWVDARKAGAGAGPAHAP